MATVEELRNVIRNVVNQNDAFQVVKNTPLRSTVRFSDMASLLEFLPIEQRVEALRIAHTGLPVQQDIDGDGLRSILSKLTVEDGHRALLLIEPRVSNLEISRLAKFLEFVREEDRLHSLELFVRTLQREPQDTNKIKEDDLAALFSQFPSDKVLSCLAILRPLVSASLDFTKFRKLLESIADKRDRLVVLKELVSISLESTPNLMSYDLLAILSAFIRMNAFNALQSVSHLISPNLDLAKVNVLFECLMSAHQVDALTCLINACQTTINSFQEINGIISKMERPLQGLECLKPRISPTIDTSKLSAVLVGIPGPERINAIKFVLEFAKNSSNRNGALFNQNDLRSVLVLIEEARKLDALRLLRPYVLRLDQSGNKRVLECFSEGQHQTAEILLQDLQAST